MLIQTSQWLRYDLVEFDISSCNIMCWQQRTSKSRSSFSCLHILNSVSMNHILRGVNPGWGLPSNQDPEGTKATSLICASRRIYLSPISFPPPLRGSGETFPGLIDSDVINATARIRWYSLVKYFPSNNLVIRSYGNVRLLFSLYSLWVTFWLAEERHCRNTITSKWDLTAKAGFSAHNGWLSSQSQPQVSTHCHMLCEEALNEDGFAQQCETLLLSPPNWWENW